MGEAIKTDMNLLYYLMWKTEIQMEIRCGKYATH